MKWNDLIERMVPYKVSLSIDNLLRRSTRLSVRYFFLILSLTFFTASFIDFKGISYNSLPDGLFFLFISLFSIMSLLEFFYNSSKFSSTKIDFVVAQIIFETNDSDLTAGFLNSRQSRELLSRLGISKEQKESFLNSEREPIKDIDFEINEDVETNKISFAVYAKEIYVKDKALTSFLSARGVGSEDFVGAAEWISTLFEKRMKREHWWSKQYLDTISSLGTGFSYGVAYELSKYATFIEEKVSFEGMDIDSGYREKEVIQIENALVRGVEANAIVISDDETIAKDVIARLGKRIKLGVTPPILEHKVVLELDWSGLLADNKSKPELEEEFLKILYECKATGNIILYIPNLPTFISEAKKVGVNISSAMEEYLVSPTIHIIAHSIKTDFYYFIEMNPGLGRVFERIVPEDEGAKLAMPAILEKASRIEKDYKGRLFFTYPALREISELSERLVAYGQMPTKAIDMLIEITPWAIKGGINVVLKNDVDSFSFSKTGIATGEIGGAEREKLTRLEELLHQRIVGQKEAVSAVSSAMRRSRAGVGNPKRPIASFLFLGPTGVGKTETSKALAESFFGDEEKMIRFDMSEYKGVDAMPRLIGSFSEGKMGNLASKLRDNPYAVVLLDELEKAAPDVLDLFLRIIDEGKFTDAFATEVSVRNAIIIATSNAGSEMIWNIVKNGENLEVKKESIIDHLIDTHTFKPELLNRFDAIVVFKPLLDTELRSVAEIMLNRLILQLRKEKQIELKPSSELLDYLVLHGSDREFGARSIARIMQQKIENVLAKKIIDGTARAGNIVEIGVKDIL